MKRLIQSAIFTLLTFAMTSISFGRENQNEKITFSQVPAIVMKQANQIEQQVDWTQAILESRKSDTANSSLRRYVLKGRIVIQSERQKVTSDGDVEIIPGQYQYLEVGILDDGQLEYIVKSVSLNSVPENVMSALRKTIDVPPSEALAVRSTAKGQPVAYIIRIDSNGLLQYLVTADGKKVEKI